MEHYVTYHKILDLCEDFQIQSPILKSFGYGNLVDFGKNTSGTTTQYPFMFMVPQAITYDENTTTYQFSILFADILNTNLDNEKDCVSDMSLEARRFISFIKRGMNANPDLYNYMDIQMGVQAIPFQERFNDHTAGVALQANIIVFEDINACDYYPTPTPTVSTSATPTPTITPTPTTTPLEFYWNVESCCDPSITGVVQRFYLDPVVAGSGFIDANSITYLITGPGTPQVSYIPIAAFSNNICSLVPCPSTTPTPTTTSTPTPTPTL